MNDLQKHESESTENVLLTIIAEKGMEAFEKMIDRNAITEQHRIDEHNKVERYKIDKQTEIELRRIETTNKRIDAAERIKKRDNVAGGIAVAVVIVLIVALSVTGNLSEALIGLLSVLLTGAIGKFFGLSLPKTNNK